MLKQGRLVALEPTAELLARHAQRTLWLRLAAPARLPTALAVRLTPEGEGWSIPLADLSDVESLLAAVRDAGAGLEDMELRHADLEQVFLHLTETA
jgi:ABC-2 type transport system ATP-binding protein